MQHRFEFTKMRLALQYVQQMCFTFSLSHDTFVPLQSSVFFQWKNCMWLLALKLYVRKHGSGQELYFTLNCGCLLLIFNAICLCSRQRKGRDLKYEGNDKEGFTMFADR